MAGIVIEKVSKLVDDEDGIYWEDLITKEREYLKDM